MTNFVFTIAKGRESHYASLPGASDSLIGVLLRGVEAESTLRGRNTLADVLSANTEANFTGYARETLASVTLTVDDDAHTPIGDAADFDWPGQARTVNNTLLALLICYVPSSGAADSSIVPVWHWDSPFPQTTSDEVVQVEIPASGLWRTAEAA